MNSYTIRYSYPQHRFIQVEFVCKTNGKSEISIQLPSWRPGRYELGNFAKNVRGFSITNEKGKALKFAKSSKDCWIVTTEKSKNIIVNYEYYSADLNAGSTFVDENLLYVNPVNCCVYCVDQIDEPLTIEIHVPSHFSVACGMKLREEKKSKKEKKVKWSATNFHELADSPFIAGSHLQSKSYKIDNTKFNVWFQGECKPDWNRIITDFSAFTAAQIKAYGDFPVKEYHFLIHALPLNFYHGVEHQTSSVNVLGPSYEIMNARYVDLLGLCSHELYHAWNIKSIRPTEMFPYDYTKENYFKTGYVAEGVTTYMGDYFLLASGVFSLTDFLAEMNMQMQKHMDNFGRKNYSVADSSFDTWLDGYVPGVPERKVSIYTEGCLTAFMTDVLILKNSGNKISLHSVMKSLYHEFYKKNKAYSADDYWRLVEKYSGISFTSFRKKYIEGTESYLNQLEECLNYLGLTLKDFDPTTTAEKNYGIRITESISGSLITAIHPDSANYKSGLALNDKLIAINGYSISMDANKWMNYFNNEKITVQVLRGLEIKNIELKSGTKQTFRLWRWLPLEKPDTKQLSNFNKWKTV